MRLCWSEWDKKHFDAILFTHRSAVACAKPPLTQGPPASACLSPTLQRGARTMVDFGVVLMDSRQLSLSPVDQREPLIAIGDQKNCKCNSRKRSKQATYLGLNGERTRAATFPFEHYRASQVLPAFCVLPSIPGKPRDRKRLSRACVVLLVFATAPWRWSCVAHA